MSVVWRIAFLLVVCVWAGLAGAEEKTAPAKGAGTDSEDWQIITMSGQRIGYAHVISKTEDRDGKPVTVTEVFSRIVVKRFGGQLIAETNQRSEEDATGQLLSVYLLQDNKPFSKTETRGRVEGRTLTLDTTSSGKTFTKQIVIPADLKLATWLDRSLKETPLKVGETRTIKTFEPSLGKVTDTTVKQIAPGETKLLSGKMAKLQRAEITLSVVPGIVSTVFLDDEGALTAADGSSEQGVGILEQLCIGDHPTGLHGVLDGYRSRK